MTGMSWTLYQNLPAKLTPDEDRGIFLVSIQSPTAAAIGYTDVVVRKVEDLLAPYRENGAVEDIVSMVGQYGEANRALMVAVMSPWAERDLSPREIINELCPDFAQIMLASVRAFVPSGPGAGGGGSPLEVALKAPSFERAAEYSRQLDGRMRASPDIVDVRRDYEMNTPGYDIRVNRERACEIGEDARVISDVMRTFFACGRSR
nr:efflux RND transporter permease subunit [Rhodovulum sp. ES.010]